jgi:PIN domain nuclease of toxin-antitoxin system
MISSISIWEIGIKIKKGNLDLGLPFEEYIRRLKELSSLNIVAIDEDIWAKNISLDWTHNDLADRTIVATAMLENVPIITKDEIIRKFTHPVIW